MALALLVHLSNYPPISYIVILFIYLNNIYFKNMSNATNHIIYKSLSWFATHVPRWTSILFKYIKLNRKTHTQRE